MEPARSYRWCERVARGKAGNFYPAFRILPADQRLAMCALYAFCRIADDIGDEAGALDERRRRLEAWRLGLRAALAGRPCHPAHPALADAVARFRIPPEYLEAVLDGVAMDLQPLDLATFADLRTYCWRVASAVGLACIHIWGFRSPAALVPAEEAGIAFQLTNILRDLKEDAGRDRIYLPREDLDRFGYTPEMLHAGNRNAPFLELMRFEVDRARRHYEAAAPLMDLLEPPGQAVFRVLSGTYRTLLETIPRRNYDVFTRRVRVPAWKKMALALGALPVRFGWSR